VILCRFVLLERSGKRGSQTTTHTDSNPYTHIYTYTYAFCTHPFGTLKVKKTTHRGEHGEELVGEVAAGGRGRVEAVTLRAVIVVVVVVVVVVFFFFFYYFLFFILF
jgi:hypothetical protein